MNEQDIKSLALYYYGKSKLLEIWHQEIRELHEAGLIKKIYEVYSNGYLGAWYMIVDKRNHKYIVHHKINNVNTAFMMQQFSKYYDFIRVESDTLNIINNKKSA